MTKKETLKSARETLIQRVKNSPALFLDEDSLEKVERNIMSATSEVVDALNKVLDKSDIELQKFQKNLKQKCLEVTHNSLFKS